MNKRKNTPDKPGESSSLGDLALDLLSDDAPLAADAKTETVEAAPDKTEVAGDIADTTLDQPPVVAKLEEAVKGLEMPSETDEPFRVVFWPLEKSQLTNSEVAFYAAERADAPVETRSVAEFFQDAATVEDWMDDAERADAKRFQNLVETLNAELKNPRVYLIGERERTAAVIGQVEGGFGGVITLVVET